MSIEIRCPGCQKLLRVPDSAAGKHARCPECQQVVNVPADAAPSAPSPASPIGDPSPAGFPASASSSPSPFSPTAPAFNDPASASSGSTFKPKADPSNPYAASGFYEQPTLGDPGAGGLVHSYITFDETLNLTWNIFKANLGPLAIIGVFLFAVSAFQQIVAVVLGVSTAALRDPLIELAGNLGQQVLSILIQPVLMLGAIIPALKLLRTGHTEPGDFMQFTRYYGTTLLKDFLVLLIVIVAMVICMGPGFALMAAQMQEIGLALLVIGAVVFFVIMVWFQLSVILATQFIVDRGAGAIDSLKMSWRFMDGNRGTTFLLSLVAGLVGVLFVCCTLSFGMILLSPFFGVLLSVIYVIATGQRQTISPAALGQPVPYKA